MHEFAYSDAFVIGADIDKEKREVTIFVEVRKPCPGTWSIIIGEMVHNLRSALDHLVWQLVILETSEQPVGDRTQFPIFESEEKVDHHAPVMLKGLAFACRRFWN
jgi:hypothetical protein